MKASYKALGGRLLLEFNAESMRDLFWMVGQLRQVFEAEPKCGMCDSVNIGPGISRDKDENQYYFLLCADCEAQFRFGQTKVGGNLFPKRKDGQNGWFAKGDYGKSDEGDSGAPPRQSAPQQQPRQQQAPPPSGKTGGGW